jgi:hypothetical protein
MRFAGVRLRWGRANHPPIIARLLSRWEDCLALAAKRVGVPPRGEPETVAQFAGRLDTAMLAGEGFADTASLVHAGVKRYHAWRYGGVLDNDFEGLVRRIEQGLRRGRSSIIRRPQPVPVP